MVIWTLFVREDLLGELQVGQPVSYARLFRTSKGDDESVAVGDAKVPLSIGPFVFKTSGQLETFDPVEAINIGRLANFGAH
jgi:hypothetical protein